MPDHEEVEETIAALEPGQEVRIVTKDGREIRGSYSGKAEGEMVAVDTNADADEQVAIADVDRVLIPISPEQGPE